MLVLSRKIGERIVVSLGSETVTIELLKVSGACARIGIHAAASVAVQRQEIWDRIEAARELLSHSPPVVHESVG